MRRLLQGDVGSGKTIVALQAMLIAIENGYQAALMAPTEILATQHYLGARKLLERATRDYRITLLTGSLDLHHKRAARGRIARGEADLIIGTHALIEEKVEFDRPRPRRRRRAASLRRHAALPPDEEAWPGRARRAGHDGNPHPAHPRALALWRPRPQRSGRAAARPDAHRHAPRQRRPRRRGLAVRAQAGRRGPSGVHRLSRHRRPQRRPAGAGFSRPAGRRPGKARQTRCPEILAPQSHWPL